MGKQEYFKKSKKSTEPATLVEDERIQEVRKYDSDVRVINGLPENQQDLDIIKDEHIAIGAVMAANVNIAFNRICKLGWLRNIKKKKVHKQYGMTWADFCGRCNESVSTVDKELKDVEPLFEGGVIKSLGGLPVDSLRAIGRLMKDGVVEIENDAIVADGESIPLENRGRIQSFIDNLKADKENSEKVAREEIKKLKTQNDALTEKTQRLESMVIEVDKTPEALGKQMDAVVLATEKWVVEILKTKKIMEETGPGPEVIAIVEAKILYMEKRFKMFRSDWDRVSTPIAED